MPTLNHIVFFLINTIFVIVSYLAIVRLLLEWSRAPLNNSFTQTIIRLFKRPLKPFEWLAKSYCHINLGVILFLIILNCLQIVIIIALLHSTLPDVGGLLLSSICMLATRLCSVLFYGTILVDGKKQILSCFVINF